MSWGRFVGNPVKEDLPDGRKVRLLQNFYYIRPGDNAILTARAGLIYDGASIPPLAWPIVGGPFEGPHRDAAIIHDQYCKDGKLGQSPIASGAVHRAFYTGMRARGTSPWKARVMWAFVRTFGPRFKAAMDV